MPTVAEIDVRITGKNEASKAFQDASRDAQGFSKSLDETSKASSGMSKAVAGIGAVVGSAAISQGIGSITSNLSSFAKGAAEDAASVARLQQAVQNTGASWSTYAGQIDGVISKGQQLGFTDDQVRGSLAILTAQTGSTEEAFKRYALAQDLARGANIDLETASRLLGKVTDENVNVLARYGISVQAGASETELFGAVAQKFGGQAEAFGQSAAGMAAANSIAVDEMREAWGAKLVPVMTTALGLFQTLPSEVQAGVAALFTFGPALGQMSAGVAALIPLLGALGPVLAGVRVGIMAIATAFLTPPLGIVVAITAVIIALYIFRDDVASVFKAVFEFIAPVAGWFAGMAEGIIGAVSGAIEWLKNNWPIVAIILTGPLAPILAAVFLFRDDIIGAFNGMVAGIGEALRTAKAFVSDAWLFIVDTFEQLPGRLLQIGKDIINGLLDGMKSVVQPLFDFVGGIADKIKGLKGPISADRMLLFNEGKAIIEGLQSGLEAQWAGTQNWLGGVGTAIGGAVSRWRSAVAAIWPANEVDNALRIIGAESGGNPSAVSPTNSNGTVDRGLFQVNSIHGYDPAKLLDPAYNIAAALAIFRAAGNSWQPWSTAPMLGLRGAGGPVLAGGSYIVGEHGPEVFKPGARGYVYPNVGSGPTIVINVQGSIRSDRELVGLIRNELSLGALDMIQQRR